MAREITIYGIRNCDTMKKARRWLDDRGIEYDFHDYRANGVTASVLQDWCRQAGWEALLNRAGTTFRKLAEKDKAGLSEAKAIKLMIAQPSMIKRPVLDVDGQIIVGFKDGDYQKTLG